MPQERLTIEELNVKLEEEEQLWQKSGISTAMLQPNLFFMACQLDALIALLIENNIFTQEEADHKLKEVILENMPQQRKFLMGNKLTRGITKPNNGRG